MIIKCKNCIHWKRGGYFNHTDSGYEIIIQPKENKGICINEKIGSDYTIDWMKRSYYEGNDGIYASGYEERGGLEVGENFGCTHFEGKEL